VRFGLFIPPFEELSDPRRVAGLAAAAEQAGWSGIFLWDHMLARPGMAVAEAWTTLAAVATATREIRFGALVTPLARRRPWTLARQVATLDLLSGGRLVVGVGLGDDGWKEFSSFGEATDPRERGLLLDDSVEVLRCLLTGEDVAFDGRRLAVHATPFRPRPVQDPVPIWAAGRWPNRRPLARAARLQGYFPIFGGSDEPSLPAEADLDEVRAELGRQGVPDGHDLVIVAALHRLDPVGRSRAAAAAEGCGVTWLLEGFAPGRPAAEIEAVVADGPPAG